MFDLILPFLKNKTKQKKPQKTKGCLEQQNKPKMLYNALTFISVALISLLEQ